ncbi:MAG TPA: YkgJ family cysteine cluster protein [Polyangiaceae bacterium]
MADKVKVEFELQMGEEGVRVAVSVPVAPVPVRRMLPLFQGLANQVVDAAVLDATKRDEEVSCKAGCGACCRHLVPISHPEARQIRALVDAMPEPRRTEVRARFAAAVARLEAEGLLPDVRGFDKLAQQEFLTVHPRYFKLGIPCPFLEDESCSIYPNRPLICREYLVTSPPELCFDVASPKVKRIPMPTFVSLAVANLEGTDPSDSRLALVLALEWTDAHAADAETTRPATEWIDALLEGLARKAPANNP